MKNHYTIKALHQWVESGDGVTVDALQYCLSQVVLDIEIAREIGKVDRARELQKLVEALRAQMRLLIDSGARGEHVASESIALDLEEGSPGMGFGGIGSKSVMVRETRDQPQNLRLREQEKNILFSHLEKCKASLKFDKVQ
tara:strand:- start:14084 stop:14506 length:423 start_codon:yes stop_codon:yes gene_type:complete